jgi:hypothetical protein
VTFPPPGARDHAGEVEAVERVVPLLTFAHLPLVNRGRHFFDPETPGQYGDQQFG